ncbi:MAG: hypothetical protein BBJ60_02305 [Desulfobacterales bacterium S7086C20]|nr:MAG: hypothetical protein BBJ60_02305 [Desulfobacterales bacterium S7086C20]
MATSIEDTYELELVPIAIGGKRLEIYRVENLDCIVNALNQEPGDSTKKFPFWVKVWEASLLLSNHLLKMDLEKKIKILEIGAGMGVTGLFLGVLGYDVTITDYDEDALALIKMNVEHNGLNNVSVRRLDWNNPDLKESFNIICGSELIYNEASIHPIIRLFKTYLRPQGTIFMAHDIKRKYFMQLIGMVKDRFKIETIQTRLRSKDETHRIVIHILNPK